MLSHCAYSISSLVFSFYIILMSRALSNRSVCFKSFIISSLNIWAIETRKNTLLQSFEVSLLRQDIMYIEMQISLLVNTSVRTLSCDNISGVWEHLSSTALLKACAVLHDMMLFLNSSGLFSMLLYTLPALRKTMCNGNVDQLLHHTVNVASHLCIPAYVEAVNELPLLNPHPWMCLRSVFSEHQWKKTCKIILC